MSKTNIIGNVIRSERRARGLTQQALGELSGTGVNFISQVERGKATVRLDKILEVLSVLGLELFVQRGRHVIRVSDDVIALDRVEG